MPIYLYKCEACQQSAELWLDAPPPQSIAGGICSAIADEGPCDLRRQWSAPSIGYVDGGGFSPSRGPVK